MTRETFDKIYRYHHEKGKRENFVSFRKIKERLLPQWIGKGKKILDLGCRNGALTKYFVEGNQVLGVDVDKKLLEKCHKNLGIETKWLDLNGNWDLPKKFDVVVASEILEHLYFPEKVLDKIKEILKNDGTFIGSVPNAFSLKNRLRYLIGRKRFTPLADPTHINQFSHKEMSELLIKNFKKVKIYPLTKKRYMLLAKIFPSLISHNLLFYCNEKLI